MARVLVVGATGYLGRFALRAFKAAGWTVRAVARNEKKLESVRDVVDEVLVTEVTREGGLDGACGGVDLVFSSLGITRQNDGLTYMDVDYGANRRLLDEALRARVPRFEFVSGVHPELLRHIDMMAARERFVDELRAAEIDSVVMRPSGFFVDMSEIFAMAKQGRVYVIGDGTSPINPIHGEDLARACVDALAGGAPTVEVGGPEVLTHQQIAEMAFEVLGKPPHITHVPMALVHTVVPLLKLVSRRYWSIAAFMTTVTTHDMVAPAFGTHRLRDYFVELAASAEP